MIGKDKLIKITVSIGVANYPNTTLKVEDIKENADLALIKQRKADVIEFAIVKNLLIIKIFR